MVAMHALEVASVRQTPDDAYRGLEPLRSPDAISRNAPQQVPRSPLPRFFLKNLLNLETVQSREPVKDSTDLRVR